MDSLDREIHANLVRRQSNEFKKLAPEDRWSGASGFSDKSEHYILDNFFAILPNVWKLASVD